MRPVLWATVIGLFGFLGCASAAPTEIRAVLKRAVNVVSVLPSTVALDGPAARATVQGHIRNAGRPVPAKWAWLVRDTSILEPITTTKSSATLIPRANGTTYVVGFAKGLSDSAFATVTNVDEEPPSGTTFFLADAESGTVTPPWTYTTSTGDLYPPTNSTVRAKNGSRSIRYSVPGVADPYSQTLKGGFTTAYYSAYVYVDEGYTGNNDWNMLLGWMTDKAGAPSPIAHIGLEVRGGILQFVFVSKNCSVGLYTCPTIANYTQDSGWYLQTATSPNGITAFPREQWVHFSAYYKATETDGQITIWQDGVLVMDLTAPTLNTWGGSLDLTNPTGLLFLQFGVYGAEIAETRTIFVDDFRVSDYRPLP